MCEPSGRDRYGRTLAYCKAGAIDLNRQMVADGWAFAFVKYNVRYAEVEQTARLAKRGLWAGQAEKPWEWRAAQIAKYAPQGACVIKCNIAKEQRTYYLPFHQSYRLVKIDTGKGERWFCTQQEALTSGWQRALR